MHSKMDKWIDIENQQKILQLKERARKLTKKKSQQPLIDGFKKLKQIDYVDNVLQSKIKAKGVPKEFTMPTVFHNISVLGFEYKNYFVAVGMQHNGKIVSNDKSICFFASHGFVYLPYFLQGWPKAKYHDDIRPLWKQGLNLAFPNLK